MQFGIETNAGDWYEQTHKKIFVKSEKELMNTISEYRAAGWNLLTFGHIFTELEKGDQMVIVIRNTNRKGGKSK